MELTERAGRGIGLTPAANILVSYTDALLPGSASRSWPHAATRAAPR